MKDPRIDVYIAKSAEFAKPILLHLRRLIHQSCPEVEETMKWNFPHFEYRGILCSMAAFKHHCAFGFWNSSLLPELPETAGKKKSEAMGQFGRITRLADLPADRRILSLIKKAAKLNEGGLKRPKRSKKVTIKMPEVPGDFMTALRKEKTALAMFENFSPSHKREYIEWITEAKSEETRQRRITQAIAWMIEGKSRNRKYTKRKPSSD